MNNIIIRKENKEMEKGTDLINLNIVFHHIVTLQNTVLIILTQELLHSELH